MRALHVTPMSNIASIQAVGLLARVGERSTAAKEMPGIWMFRTWTGLEDAQWLYDQFGEGESLSILMVDLAGMAVKFDPVASFEIFSPGDIPASRVTVLCRDMDDLGTYLAARDTAVQALYAPGANTATERMQ